MQAKSDTNLKIKDSEMLPVSKEEFISGSSSPADVFLRLADGHYVLIARQGSAVKFEDMHAAERKEVGNFFVRKSDYKNCVGQNLTVAGIIMNRSEIPDSKKTEFLANTADTVFREISALGFNYESMEHSKQVANSIQRLILGKKDLLAIIDLMEGISGDLTKHSMAVSAIAVMIAHGMGWVFPQTLEKLALGGLLHDVGLKELPKDLIEKPRHMMTGEDVELFETHVFRGVQVLRSMPTVSDDLIAIVYEHHENSIGQGYPRKLRDFKMNPLSKVIVVADLVAELSLASNNNPNPKSIDQAMNFIDITLGQPFNRNVIQGLKHIVKLDRKRSA